MQSYMKHTSYPQGANKLAEETGKAPKCLYLKITCDKRHIGTSRK